MASNRFKLSRRSILRGAAGIALGLPFLEAMTDEGTAVAATRPKRLIVFFTPNGTIPDAWVSGGETNFTLGPILTPLQAHQNDIIVFTGMNNEAAHHGPGDDHQRGMGTMLTGTEMQAGSYQGGCDTCPPAGFGGGISFDQLIAKKVGQNTKLPSIELGVHVHDSDDWSRMVYTGAGQPLPPIDDPAQTFQRLFADLNADPNGQKLLNAQRHLVLDSVMSDAKKLQQRLGAQDRMKLEQHLASLDTINKHIDKTTVVGGSCMKPNDPGDVGDIYSPDNFDAVGKLQMDLLVMGLTCDITRVSSIQWTRSVGDVAFTWLGQTEGHHSISHHDTSDATAQDELIKINNWYAKQLAYLIDALKAVPEGTGTLFDQTTILWINELAIGNAHSHDDMRFLLAGSCGGKFQLGRHLSYSGDPHNNLLLSLVNAMGLPATSFGNPAYCTGPLAKL